MKIALAAKIALISAASVAVISVTLFVVIPLATSKQAEAKLSEALAEAGIPEDMWSVSNAYYVPLLGHLVVENLIFGEKGYGPFFEAKKVTLALDTGREDLLAGSVDAQDLSFSADDTVIAAKSLSVNNFSVDKELFEYSPFEAVKKLGSIRLSDAVFRQEGQTYFSLGRLNADINYTEGKIPIPSSVSINEFAMDVRQFMPLPALRPEYRLSKLELKNSLSGGVYTFSFVIDLANLFTGKIDLAISLPREFIASGEIADLSLIDFEEDVKLNSLVLTYTDKSLLDHVFELAGMPGSRESIAEQLYEALMMFAMMGEVDMGEVEAERFVREATKFIANAGKMELKTNIHSPLSMEDISRNPFAINLSLSINGGKPFTTGDF